MNTRLDDNWWDDGPYIGDACIRCDRERVMLVTAPDSSDHRVCEKCGWDQDASDFAGALEFSSEPKND